MRRAAIIFLTLLVQFQLVWGAATPYCGHEARSAAASGHFGHHEHRHAADDLKAKSSTDAKLGLSAADGDCASCHLGASGTLPPASFVVALVPGGNHFADSGHRYRSHFPSVLDRPDRS